MFLSHDQEEIIIPRKTAMLPCCLRVEGFLKPKDSWNTSEIVRLARSGRDPQVFISLFGSIAVRNYCYKEKNINLLIFLLYPYFQ